MSVERPVGEPNSAEAAVDKMLDTEYDALDDERDKLQNKLEAGLADILGLTEEQADLDPGDLAEQGPEFKFSQELYGAIKEHQGDPAAVRAAINDIQVPMLMKMGTVGKIQRLVNSPDVDRLFAIGKILYGSKE